MRSTTPPLRQGARRLMWAVAVALGAYVAYVAFDLGEPFSGFWDRVYNAIEFGAAALCFMRAYAFPEERRPWVLLGIACAAFACGDVYWTIALQHADDIPVPSPADAGYLLFYPFAYAALVFLVRARGDRYTPGLWLEGLIGTFAVAAVGAALLQQPIEDSTGGSWQTVATSLAYPLADVLLFSLVVGIITLTGPRHAATWALAAVGFGVFAVADAVYGYQTAAGTYVDGTILDAGWPAAFALLGAAAWRRPERVSTSRLEGWHSVVLPGIFGLTGLGLLMYASLKDDVYVVAVILAAISLLAVIARMALMVVQRLRTVGELGASEERYRALVRSLPDTVIALFDRRLRLTFADGAGIRDRALFAEGRAVWDFAPPDQRTALEAQYREALAGSYSAHELTEPDTGRTWYIEIGPYCPDGRNPEGVFSVARDITGRKQAEDLLAHQALHDSLTGLANRVLFMDRLELALHRLDRDPAPMAILFTDLDRFKVVNDSLGHAAGDEVLVQAADRLRRALRPVDTVARFGGDEFVLLCESVAGSAETAEIARRVHQALSRPFKVAGQEIVLTGSIGIVLNADPKAEAGALLRDADTAMYWAKERGRANWQFFDSTMRMRAVQRLELETELRRAIDHNDLRVLYQPQVEFETGQVVACEALVRWAQQDKLVGPMDFIPVAEESGLIIPLGDWVLRKVCRDMAGWSEPMTVDVNLSPRQLVDPDLVAKVAECLNESGIEPSRICFEVTESALFTDPETAMLRLTALRELGVRLAIDDFGIGFSSLFHLRQLPDVDMLKIDRAFVTELGRNRKDSAIVASVIVLAGSLGMKIVAEGVETEEQAAELRSMGADYGQGWYLGEPREIQDIGELTSSSLPIG